MSSDELLNKLQNAIYQIAKGKKEMKNNNNNLANRSFKDALKILNKLKLEDDINNINLIELISSTETECKKNLSNNIDVFNLISENNYNEIYKIKKFNYNEINKNGNTILHHCIKCGDVKILVDLLKKGGKIDQVNNQGYTLLEYACIINDPNIIKILNDYGSNMEKHIYFRKSKSKMILKKSDIDLAILLKIIIINSFNKSDYSKFEFLNNYFNIDSFIGIDNFKVIHLLIGLHHLFKSKNSYNTYKKIIIEELNNFVQIDNCEYEKLDLILINLVPFINYPFNIATNFILKKEIIILLNKIKNQISINLNKKNYKNILFNELSENYIKKNLFPLDYIGILTYQIFLKN